MSKKEKETGQEEKIVTRYDRKLQRRREQQEKEKREKRIGTVVGIIAVVALAALAASFPIRTYMAVNETYVVVGGEKITRVEFDFNYNLAKNNYMNQYGAYMSYFGVDMSKDLSQQMYSDTLTWKDYFEQQAVDNIVKNKALQADAAAAGFTSDISEEWKDYEASLKEAAGEEGMALNKYLKESFGPYATMSRLSGYIKSDMLVSAYYEKLTEDKEPTGEEIEAYYQDNKADYDSVDYRVTEAAAKLPEEPTELADPEAKAAYEEQQKAKEEAAKAEGTGSDGTDTAGDNGAADNTAADEPYQPSEAEIEAAMKEAKAEADKAVKTVASSGDVQENVKKSGLTSVLRDWLFDESRKAGDTTVIEDSAANKYYAVAFEKRYLDETPSADVRVIMAGDTDAQTILDEWKGGEATEDSFIALCSKYSEDAAGKENGGLLEAVLPSGMDEAIGDWLFAAERQKGDTTAVTLEDGYNYVMYYIGQNEPEWKLTIKSKLLSDVMSDYLEQISEGIQVEDNKGKLNYLKVQAMEEADASAAAESTDESGAAGTEQPAENSGAAGTEQPADESGAAGTEQPAENSGAAGTE